MTRYVFPHTVWNDTYENALDWIAEVLLGEGHGGGGEEGGGGDPVVQAEYPAVDADLVEVGESTHLVEDVEAAHSDAIEVIVARTSRAEAGYNL